MQVIDNYLPADQFKFLQDNVLAYEFPWFYQQHVSLPPEDGNLITDPNAVETFGYSHTVYDAETNYRGYFEMFEPLLYKLKQDIPTIKFTRIRLSMKTYKKGFTRENYNLPHVDYTSPHKTLIYYINTSDGPTWVFNEKFTGFPEPTQYTVKDKIDPVENRMLFIDGLQYHTASNPIDNDRRVIVNINYYD